MRCELNIDMPRIRTYLRQGYPVSMVENEDWIYDKYIQLYYDKSSNNNKYVNYVDYNFFEKDGVFFKGYHLFPYKKRKFLIREIIQLIDKDWFYFGKWNELYIPGTYYHMKKIPYEHRNCVYGYDSDKKVFLVQGYLADWKWHTYEVKFYDFYKGLINQNGVIEYETYKRNASCKLEFMAKNMQEELNEYVSGTWSSNNNRIYGIHGVKLFWQEIANAYIESRVIDQASVYIFLERIQTMNKRLEMIYKMGIIMEKEFEYLVNRCEKIELRYGDIVNQMLKYNIVCKDAICRWISNEGKRISEEECDFFEEILRTMQ